MADEDDSQKTEEPTQKRLEDARNKGQVPVSREVNNWLVLLGGTIAVGSFSPGLMSKLAHHLEYYIEHADDYPGGGGFATLVHSFWVVLGLLAVPLLFFIFMAIAGPFLQTGPLFTTHPVKPELSKISPMQGISRLFSLRSIVEFLKGLAKISLVSIVAWMLIKPYFGRVDHMVGLPVAAIMDETMALVMRLLIGILIAMAFIAVADLVYQRQQHMKKMRMSKQELKDEYKQSEGSPEVKAKLRQLRQMRARQRMMQNVPKADVVITNPTHFAVALQYDPDTMDAPVCLAKGVDELALRIRTLAKENDIVIYENPPLARVLYDTVEIDGIIPPEHYKAVAEVISYVFRMRGSMR